MQSGKLQIQSRILTGSVDELVVQLFAEGVTRTTIRGIAAPRTVIEVPTQNLIAYG